jgi:type IV secretion system protein TrbE
MRVEPTDGFFGENVIVFEGLHRGGFISRGFEVTPSDLENADPIHHNALESDLTALLAGLKPNHRLQVQWDNSGTFRPALLKFRGTTAERATNSWTQRVRNEIFVREWGRDEAGRLRRERLRLYFTMPVDADAFGPTRGRASTAALLSAYQEEFHQIGLFLEALFGGAGGRVRAMTDADHFLHYLEFLNPSLPERKIPDPLEFFDPEKSIQENCWHGECRPLEKPDTGFYHDGYYHGMLVLKSLPKRTRPGIAYLLTKLGFRDYGITVNIEPVDVERLIDREQKELTRVEGDYESLRKIKLLAAMKTKAAKIARYSNGDNSPYRIQYIIRAWDKTREDLRAKLTALKAAVGNMERSQAYEPALETSARNFFYSSWPGWSFSRYTALWHDYDDALVANILPFSSTPVGHLEDAEFLFEGANGNLVGGRTFCGEGNSLTPQNAVVLGTTGAGKSVLTISILSQTECYYGFTMIAEEGGAYNVYGKTVDPHAEPIVIQANGKLTMNYLDTRGLPLSGLHLSAAAALPMLMVGQSKDEDKNKLRQALLVNAINRLYDDFARWHANKHPDTWVALARRACALDAYRRERMGPQATDVDAFLEFAEFRQTRADEADAFLARFSETEITRFAKDAATAPQVRNLVFADFAPADHPQHGHLQELLAAEAAGPHADEMRYLATLLEPWSANGAYGELFDGVSNVNLTGKIAHFELGCIPESAEELKAAAAFLIANYTRSHMMRLPRGLWKRNVFEEVARFALIPTGKKVLRESYQQLRKYNVWNLASVQNYEQFRSSDIRGPVLGNSRILFLMRQSDRADVEDLAKDFPVPDTVKDAVMSHPEPEKLVGQKYSQFTYYHTDERRPLIVTMRNVASREMLYCASSSGAHHDQRAKEIKGHANVVDAIVANA